MGWQETVSVPGGMEEWGECVGADLRTQEWKKWGRERCWGKKGGDGEMQEKEKEEEMCRGERREWLSERNISRFSEELLQRGAKAAGSETEWRKLDVTNLPISCTGRARERERNYWWFLKTQEWQTHQHMLSDSGDPNAAARTALRSVWVRVAV